MNVTAKGKHDTFYVLAFVAYCMAQRNYVTVKLNKDFTGIYNHMSEKPSRFSSKHISWPRTD
jgi:hypothetical protein